MISKTFVLLAWMIVLNDVSTGLQQNSAGVDGLKIDQYLAIYDKGRNSLLQVALQENNKEVKVYNISDTFDEDVAVLCLDPSTGDRAYRLPKRKTIVSRKQSITFEDEVLQMEFDPCGDQLFWNTESGIHRWKVNTNSYQSILSVSLPKKILSSCLDLNRNHVYWTQRDNGSQKGEVWRARADGSDVTKVFTFHSVVHAITIDHELYMLNVMSATGHMLYMMPLDLMEDVKDLRTTVHIDYETKRYVKSESIIADMVSYHGRIYFVHPESGRIFRFNVILGPSSMEEYGSVTILQSDSISFFSRAHYDRNIASIRRCKRQLASTEKQDISRYPSSSATPAPSIHLDREYTTGTSGKIFVGAIARAPVVHNYRTTLATTTLQHRDDRFPIITDETSTAGYIDTTVTVQATTSSDDEDSDVTLGQTTQSYAPKRDKKVVETTTSDSTVHIKTALQQTSTTTPMIVSTPFFPSNTEAKPSVSQQDTLISLVEVSSLGLDRTHPCYKITERSEGGKRAVARAFQLCAALSGLLRQNSHERS